MAGLMHADDLVQGAGIPVASGKPDDIVSGYDATVRTCGTATHRSGRIGSPIVAGSRTVLRLSRIVGCVSVIGLLATASRAAHLADSRWQTGVEVVESSPDRTSCDPRGEGDRRHAGEAGRVGLILALAPLTAHPQRTGLSTMGAIPPLPALCREVGDLPLAADSSGGARRPHRLGPKGN
jgi:hypothetical protein